MMPDITLNPHFIYPNLLLLIPLWLLAVFVYTRLIGFKPNQDRNWDDLVDKVLQPFVISGYATEDNEFNQRKQRNKSSRITTWLITLAGLLTLLALSGPSLHKRQVALYENQQGLVIALDLSASMLAQDIQPSRLQRAKFAIIDLLKQRKTGYTALVVFAGDAFAVTPLTNDVETIFAQLTHMSPSIMPTQGSRLDKAIFHSTDLLTNASYHTGKILLITDGLSNLSKSIDAAHLAHEKGYEVSALAIGTEAGATIPVSLDNGSDGGLDASLEKNLVLLNKEGNKVIATLNSNNKEDLQAVVKAGNGILLVSTAGNSSIPTLVNRYKASKKLGTPTKSTLEFPINAGVWLLFPVVLIVLLLFHRGLIWVLCVIMLLPSVVLMPSQEVYAADSGLSLSSDWSSDWSWDSLWLNSKQQARKILINPSKHQQYQDQVDIKTIQEKQVFSDNYWKAATAYRAKNYELAIELYTKENSAEAWYNKGNALVKTDKLEAALAAYQTALEKQPEHKDAGFNLNLVRKRQEEIAKAARKDNSKDKPTFELTSSPHSSSSQTENNKYSKDKKLLQSIDQEQVSLRLEQKIEKNREQRAFDKQWLNSIPDDPSGLWRRKFLFQYKKQYQKKQPKQEQVEEQQW